MLDKSYVLIFLEVDLIPVEFSTKVKLSFDFKTKSLPTSSSTFVLNFQ